MPFRAKTVLPVLPKPDHLVGASTAKTLTAIEDKELRKKLRNRQSALAARERKKARMIELEQKVAELEQSNKQLVDENSRLRQTLSAILYSSSPEKNSSNLKQNSVFLENENVFHENRKTLESAAIVNDTHSCTYFNCNQLNKSKISSYGKLENLSSPIDYSMRSSRKKVDEMMSSTNGIFANVPIKSEATQDYSNETKALFQLWHEKENSNFKRHTIDNALPANCETGTFINKEKSSYVELNESTRAILHSSQGVPVGMSATKRKARIRQPLPSIAAVLNSPTKLPRLNHENHFNYPSNSFTLAQNATSLSNVPVCATSGNLGLRKADMPQSSPSFDFEQSHKSNFSRRSQRDPYLHQANEVNSADFKMSSLYLFTKTANPGESLLPADISTMADEYSKDDILQMHLTDSGSEHSPLDSVSSGDSGVCADDDPLDWIPDVTFFNN